MKKKTSPQTQPWMLMIAMLFCLAGCKPAPQSEGGAATDGSNADRQVEAVAGRQEGEASMPTGGAGGKLVIVSPHDEFIKREFGDAFAAWHAERHPGAAAPQIEWQDRGGSVEINKYLVSTYEALGDKKDQGVGIDLYFGGGQPAHAQLKAHGISAPVELDPAILAAIPAELGGVLLRDPKNLWVGAVLSSFGIIYNKQGLLAKAIPEPATWADLADPRFINTLILADPAKSGSARLSYEVILQKHGWEQGWGLLMKIAGNAREFTASSSAVPREVAQGSALAGMCIDYYGFSQIAEAGAETVGYVTPLNATAIGPDPIGMLRGAPNPELAREFITFVLSPAAQNLWIRKASTPGGPKQHNLYRLPILPEVYQQDQQNLLISLNPYGASMTFNVNEATSDKRAPILGPLFNAAFLSNKQALQQAWQALALRPDALELAAKFTAVPFSEEQAFELAKRYGASPRDAIQLDREWQALFRARYDEIIAAAR